MPIARDEVQTLTVTATGGSYTLTSAYGTTAALAWNATAAQVTTALNAVATTPPHAFRVTGSGPAYTVRFKGPTVRHATHPLITAGTGSLTGGTASVVRTVAGQAGDRTSIRLTNRKTFVSVNGAGGDTSDVMADATSFSFFARLRVRSVGGDQLVGGLTSGTTGGHNGASLALGIAPGLPYTVQAYVTVHDGSANYPFNFNVIQFGIPASGAFDVVAAFTGVRSGTRWVFTRYDQGQAVSGTEYGPDPYPNLGKLGDPPRFVMGMAASWGAGDADNDNNFDDVYLWKDRVLTPAEVFDLTNDIRDVEDLYPADLVVCIDGDGEAGTAVAAGDAGLVNRAGLDFDTIDALSVHTGTSVYDVNLIAQPTIPLAATVFRSGKTMAFTMGVPEGAGGLDGIGSFGSPYPPPTTHPTIRINGGAPVTLIHPFYIQVYGPKYLIYNITGGNGPLATPIAAGDAVTFSITPAWLSARVDGQLARTLGYTDEPATNETGTPFVLPAERRHKVGVVTHMRTLHAGYRIDGFGDPSAMIDVTTQATVTLNNNYFTSPGKGWGGGTDTEIRYGYPSLPPGRYCLTWEGAYNFGTAQPDRIEDLGTGPSWGPFAGRPISWLDTTVDGRLDLEPIERAGTPAEPHLAYFTIAYLEGNVGHRCMDSVDTTTEQLTRPCPATGSYLQFRAFGTAQGGVSGPRANLNLYHLGPVGAEWYDPADGPGTIPEFYPPIVRCMKDARIAIHRANYTVFDACQLSQPSLDYVARWDEPDRCVSEFPIYPEGKLRTPITSVANYVSPGPPDPNLALRPPTNFGCLLVVTTGVPHTLVEGSMFFVTSSAGNVAPTYLAIANNGATGAGDLEVRNRGGIGWDYAAMVVHRVLSPTQVLIFTASNHGMTAHVELATSPMAPPGGNMTIPWTDSICLPDEMVRLAVQAETPRVWMCTPLAFSDADMTEVFTRFAEAMVGNDILLLMEVGNETWNDLFYPSQWVKSQVFSMSGSGAAFSAAVSGGALASGTVTAPGSGYFYGHDGWYKLVVGGPGTGAHARAHFVGGAADSVEVVAGGTGYTTATLALPAFNTIRTAEHEGRMSLMAVMVHRQRDLCRAAFTAAGIDPDRARYANSIQNFSTGMADEFMDYWTIAGWGTDDLFFCPTNYDGTNFGPTDPPPHPLSDPYRHETDDTDQLIDRNIAFYRWYRGATSLAHGFRQWADSAGYAHVPIYAYEGGITTVVDNHNYYAPQTSVAETNKWHSAWNPSWKAISHPRFYEVEGERAIQLNGALDIENKYGYGGDANGYGTWVDMWNMAHVPAMQAGYGDGSDGKFDNRTAPFAWNDIVAVNMQFYGDWNADAVGSLATGPPVASLVAETTYRITAATPTGGEPPYTYTHEEDVGGTWTVRGTGQVLDVVGAAPGSVHPHRVTVADAAWITASAVSAEITVTTLTPPAGLWVGPVVAGNVTYTSYTVTAGGATGGVPPYTYVHDLWDGAAWVPTYGGPAWNRSSLTPATTYRHRVVAYDSLSAASPPSAETSVATGDNLAVPPPVASQVTDTHYRVTAAPTGGIPPYTIVHERYDGSTWDVVFTGNPYDVTGATPETSYEHRVTVTDSLAVSNESSPITVTTLAGPPLATGPPAASLITDTSYRITAATPTGGVPPYGIFQERWDGAAWESINDQPVADFAGATPGTAYRHRIHVYDGADPYDEVVSAEITVTTTGGEPPPSGGARPVLLLARRSPRQLLGL